MIDTSQFTIPANGDVYRSNLNSSFYYRITGYSAKTGLLEMKVVGHEEHTRFLGIEYLDKYYTKIDPSKEIKADHPAVGDIYAPRATLSFEYQLIAFDEKTQLFSMVYLNDKCPYVRTITKDIINEFYLFKENRPVTFNFAKPAEPSKPEKVEKKSIPNYWY